MPGKHNKTSDTRPACLHRPKGVRPQLVAKMSGNEWK